MGSDWALSQVEVEIQVGVGGYPDIFSQALAPLGARDHLSLFPETF